MTYFSFLGQCIGLPLLLLMFLTWYRRCPMPSTLLAEPFWRVLGIHVMAAIGYTTPWDNYLVATGVWWYDPHLVTGWLIGWVPLEEYTFFVLQTLLAGLWWRQLAQYFGDPPALRPWTWLERAWLVGGLGLLWGGMAAILITSWQPGTYLALELTWALPPIMIQLALGADILWQHRRLVGTSLASLVAYLALADAYAIHAGTWTISPTQTLGWHIGILPVEEFVFFMLTNILVVFGLTLFLAKESQRRVSPTVLARLGWLYGTTTPRL